MQAPEVDCSSDLQLQVVRRSIRLDHAVDLHLVQKGCNFIRYGNRTDDHDGHWPRVTVLARGYKEANLRSSRIAGNQHQVVVWTPV